MEKTFTCFDNSKVYKTKDEENYSRIVFEEFESYTVAVDELCKFVEQNRGERLDLTIRIEDFIFVSICFSKLLKDLYGLGLPEKSIIVFFI